MKAENVIKTAGVVVTVAGKVVDVVSKSNSDNKKATCDTTGKIVDATATVAKSAMETNQISHADVEFDREYKKSDIWDKIVEAKINQILEDETTNATEKLEQLDKIGQEVEDHDEKNKKEASEDRKDTITHKTICNLVSVIVGSGVVLGTALGVASGVALVYNKKFK